MGIEEVRKKINRSMQFIAEHKEPPDAAVRELRAIRQYALELVHELGGDDAPRTEVHAPEEADGVLAQEADRTRAVEGRLEHCPACGEAYPDNVEVVIA